MDRSSTAVWNGTLIEGAGLVDLQSGAMTGQSYSFGIRFVDGCGKAGTNPEELLAAAHASCFAMQLSHYLAGHGTPAVKLEAKAVVTLVPGTGITRSTLTVVGAVPEITGAQFKALADKASMECPISFALGSIDVTLHAKLAPSWSEIAGTLARAAFSAEDAKEPPALPGL